MYLKDGVDKLVSVGALRKAKFEKLGVKTVEDLLRFQPRSYLDLRKPLAIKDLYALEKGEKAAVFAAIEKISFSRTARRGVFVIKAKLVDESGSVEAVWFNQRYLKSFLKEGDEHLFYGTLGFDFSNKKIALLSSKILPQRDIFLIYPQTAGLTSRQISQTVKSALAAGYAIDEYLPKDVIAAFNLLSLDAAVSKMHFPRSEEDFTRSKERFDFEEVFSFICENIIQNNAKSQKRSLRVYFKRSDVEQIMSSLPFKLTADQEKAIFEILGDLCLEHPMNRLLLGDVGSGKTIVTLIVAYFVIKSGFQVVYLAPTEILSNQHLQTATDFLGKYGFKISEITAKSKNENLAADLIIGTHAVLNRDLDFKKIGLVVIDEQHRFGVEQRSRLIEKGRAHLLSLSATPIPRTIGHMLFGNLAISQIKTKPVGRKKVKTFVISKDKKNDAFLFVDKLIEQGQQAFIICPLIENQNQSFDTLFEIDELKSIEKELEEIKGTCLGLRRVASINGKMKSKDKEKIMQDFRDGKVDVLVSTSVVEVGVDIPKATVMMVEGADRFGLSQLHQFRGRVGRNEMQAFCFLFPGLVLSSDTLERLKAFVRIDDGFKLSKIDLKLRGAGKLFGLEQSGFGDFNPRWLEDEEKLEKINHYAQKTIEQIDKYPLYAKRLTDEMAIAHLE